MSNVVVPFPLPWLLFLALQFGVVSFALAQNPGPGAAKPSAPKAPVEFTEARSYRVGQSLRLPGSTRSPRKADVASPAAGLVRSIHFGEGQTVGEGDLLAVLDTRSLEIHKQTLTARLQETITRGEATKNRFDRASELSEAKLISTEQLDAARFEFLSQAASAESLKSEIAEVQHSISLSEIRAPFAGVVSRKQTEIGQWLKVGDPLLSLVLLDRMEVVVDLPEAYLGMVRPGLSAKVDFESLGGSPRNGLVAAILPEALGDTRTFPVLISVENPKFALKAGMLAMVEFQSNNAHATTIVPKDAVVRNAKGQVIFVIGPNQKVVATPVIPGDGAGDWVAVGAAVRSGEKVVIRGNERLTNGQEVAATHTEYPLP